MIARSSSCADAHALGTRPSWPHCGRDVSAPGRELNPYSTALPFLEDKSVAQCLEIRQKTIEEYFEQEIGWDSEYLQLSPGPLNFATTFVELPGIEVFWNRFGSQMRLREIYNGGWIM